MLYAVLFEDEPAVAARLRAELMPDHLAFLDRHADAIRAAGPLRDPATGAVEGGLWLVEAGTEEDVAALCREDPFGAAGLRRSIRIRAWTQVFAEGHRSG